MDALSGYQKEVLELVGQGMSNKEIADALNATAVQNEIRRIESALGIHGRATLMLYWLEEYGEDRGQIAACFLQLWQLPPRLRHLVSEMTRTCMTHQNINSLEDLLPHLQERRRQLSQTGKTPELLDALEAVNDQVDLQIAIVKAVVQMKLPTWEPEIAWLRLVRIGYLAQEWTIMSDKPQP